MSWMWIVLLLLLTACGSDSGGRVTPPIGPGWQFAYSSGVSGSCDNFDFPQVGSGSVHYCIRQMSVTVGQVITMTFTIAGTGQLVPVQSDDILPATVSLFMQRRGDDLSCVGSMQQARYWATARVALTGPGTYVLTAPVTPDKWTDCYGKPGSEVPTQFNATVNNLAAVGYTFGGVYFAGHGVAANGPSHFTLQSYGTGLQHKRRRK